MARLGHLLALVFLVAASAGAYGGAPDAPTCKAAGSLVKVPELPEGSGVATGRQSPGRLWTHNDSGEPELVALDSHGTAAGRVRVSGAEVEDWEALAVGTCETGTCLYIGDIGDNDAKRREITIYRVPEPANASGSVSVAETRRARYPDGAHDAEAILVTPEGDILIVTKGRTGPVMLYRLPSDAESGGPVTLERVGMPRQPGRPPAEERITDGAVSPSGEWVALRSTTAVRFYRTRDLMSGNWREQSLVSLKEFGEPQGEGIAFGDEQTLYIVGEGGGKSRPGTFGRLTCAL